MHQNDSDWPREPALLNAESRRIPGTVCFRGSRWQGEVERRATPAVAVGPDLSAMRFDDRLADCEAHTAALWFGGEEGIEDLVRCSGRQPTPVSLTEISTCPHSSRFRLGREHSADLLRCLDAIEHQVHQYLLQLHPVRRHFWEDRRQGPYESKRHTRWLRPAAAGPLRRFWTEDRDFFGTGVATWTTQTVDFDLREQRRGYHSQLVWPEPFECASWQSSGSMRID
jgi:PIN domain